MQYTFASQYRNPLDTRRSHTKDSANVSKERSYSFRIACHLTTGNGDEIIIVTPSHVFITFEGIDGSGKSTQAQMLQDRLQQQGHSVLLVREPGGVPLAEHIREILLSDDAPISPFAELLLFSAARAQLVREKIKPALDTRKTVICDRFYDSTTAYQGAGRGVADPSWLADFHLEVTGGLVPDLTFLVDVPLNIAKSRRDDRTDVEDRMEAGGDAFFQKIRDAYLELAAQNPTRFRVLDGTASPESIHAQIVEAVSTLSPSY